MQTKMEKKNKNLRSGIKLQKWSKKRGEIPE